MAESGTDSTNELRIGRWYGGLDEHQTPALVLGLFIRDGVPHVRARYRAGARTWSIEVEEFRRVFDV
jgi:hypothetical protein